jgi:hypothetical protein
VGLLHQQKRNERNTIFELDMTAIITESAQFFTATILEWKKLSE